MIQLRVLQTVSAALLVSAFTGDLQAQERDAATPSAAVYAGAGDTTGKKEKAAAAPESKAISPVEAGKIPGAPFKLVKNWDFGASGNIRNTAELTAEFDYHDHWGTISNGTNYGAVTVAPNAETAIAGQPIEDPARPTREFTGDSMLAHVRPLSTTQSTVSASRHDAGNGSLTGKWTLPSGGKLLGQDLVWETRVRMPKQAPGYWYALWTSGKKWEKGAELDVLESFGAPHTPGNSFHADSVGGTNMVDYKSWPDALNEVGVPQDDRALSDYHVWTWVYLHDDTYEIYYDGVRVQHGVMHWTYGGADGGEPVEMYFLFDFSWGHTQVNDVNIELPAASFGVTYEIDYSRVYTR
jgi:hypothetical protein